MAKTAIAEKMNEIPNRLKAISFSKGNQTGFTSVIYSQPGGHGTYHVSGTFASGSVSGSMPIGSSWVSGYSVVTTTTAGCQAVYSALEALSPIFSEPIQFHSNRIVAAQGEYSVVVEEFAKFSKFLEKVLNEERVSEERGLDLIFREIDSMLCMGKFSECDAGLREILPEAFSTTSQVGFLAITLSARDHLPSRRQLFDKIASVIAGRDGLKKANALLSGLD